MSCSSFFGRTSRLHSCPLSFHTSHGITLTLFQKWQNSQIYGRHHASPALNTKWFNRRICKFRDTQYQKFVFEKWSCPQWGGNESPPYFKAENSCWTANWFTCTFVGHFWKYYWRNIQPTLELEWARGCRHKIHKPSIYVLKQLKRIVAVTKPDLLQIYQSYIPSMLEYNLSLFAGLSAINKEKLEKIRKRCHRIIWGLHCECSDLPTLSERSS